MISFETPLGWVHARGTETVDSVRIGGPSGSASPEESAPTALERAVQSQLEGYLSGARTVFDLPLADAGTPLQRDVWALLDGIPYGQSVSYGHIARELGLPPAAARAVGAAVGANPILIVRPCHRVLGANGSLTGYAGGLDAKLWLLQLEGVLL